MNTYKQLLLVVALGLASIFGARAAVNIPMWECDIAHSGVNPNEATLTPGNVNSASFGFLFSQPIDGQSYGQVLYASNITVGAATHNVIYLATEHDSVYAFDADNNVGANANALWQKSLIPPGAEPIPNPPQPPPALLVRATSSGSWASPRRPLSIFLQTQSILSPRY